MGDFILAIAPVVIVAITVVLLVNGVKRKCEKKKVYDIGKVRESTYEIEGNDMALGMLWGGAIVSIFPNIFGENSISYGICFGIVGGMIMGMLLRKRNS